MRPRPTSRGCSKRWNTERRITITKHGVPIAVLAPVAYQPHRGVEDVIAELRHFSQGITLGEVGVRELIEEGRR
ncbi:MAG: type II toxin-antitoxin system prevent-host-death family antitoxin [Candidatus Dormiibacterota bacterium]